MPKKSKQPSKAETTKIIILVLIIIGILSATVFRQIIVKTLALVVGNNQKKKSLVELVNKSSYLQNLDQNRLNQRVKQVEAVFPSRKPVLELINSLKNLASKDKVSLGGFSLKPGKLEDSGEDLPVPQKTGSGTSQLESFEITFEVTGSFNDISRFTSDLEKTAPLMKIDSLSLTIKNKDQQVSLVTAAISVTVFYQKPPDTIPAVDSPVVKLSEKEEEILNELSIFNYPNLTPATGVYQGKSDLFRNSP